MVLVGLVHGGLQYGLGMAEGSGVSNPALTGRPPPG